MLFACCLQLFVRACSKFCLLQSRASELSPVGACSAHLAAELFIRPLADNFKVPINKMFAFSPLFPSVRADIHERFVASFPCVRIVAFRRLFGRPRRRVFH